MVLAELGKSSRLPLIDKKVALLSKPPTDEDLLMLAQAALTIRGSAIRELLNLTDRPEIISFAGGLPAPELFPDKDTTLSTTGVIYDKFGPKLFQYGATEGLGFLREVGTQYLQEQGVIVEKPEQILITTGSQQGLDLVGKLLINPGDVVCVESPTYLGVLQSWKAYRPEFVEVATDEEGIIPEKLKEILEKKRLEKKRVKILYFQPNHQNPTGVTLSAARRPVIAQDLEEYGVIGVEDDPYNRLNYEETHVPPVQFHGPDRVIYLTSGSKTVAPALRTGFVVAPEWFLEKMVLAKQGADLFTSTFDQAFVAQLIQSGWVNENLARARIIYKQRLNIMLQVIKKHFPAEFTTSSPSGGFFLFVRGPAKVDMEQVLNKTLEKLVAFVPGDPFFASQDPGRPSSMRLNYSGQKPVRIHEGGPIIGAILARSTS